MAVAQSVFLGTQVQSLQNELTSHSLVIKYKDLNKAFNELKKQALASEQSSAATKLELEKKVSSLESEVSALQQISQERDEQATQIQYLLDDKKVLEQKVIHQTIRIQQLEKEAEQQDEVIVFKTDPLSDNEDLINSPLQ